jgi:pimeloyl-ACP methyl ester carboxylesterase
VATFVMIHGAGDVGWYWHLVQAELGRRGHDAIAPDLPCDDNAATLDDYADTVIEAIGSRRDLVVVGQSYGAFTAPLVADRAGADMLVLVAGMVPVPGESPARWWANTGYSEAVREQARRDGGLTGSGDPFVAFYHDVPRDLAEQAMRKERDESDAAYQQPWPLTAWPVITTRFVLCTEDRFFPPGFLRRVVADRLALIPDEITSGHCVALSHPAQLADLLIRYVTTTDRGAPQR